MNAVATVVVPTHVHASTLDFAVGSVLTQTVEDLAVVILGDGVDDRTREAAGALCGSDERVRFVDCPKGARHEETHRHDLLGTLSSPYVLYLSDDDLWLPEHAKTMIALLERGADAAGARFLAVLGTGELTVFSVDLASAAHRDLMTGGFNRVGLSGMAHSLEAYERLPHGWRTTPAGTPTDLHMWRQWIDEPWVAWASAPAVDVINFPSGQREHQTDDERRAELSEFVGATQDPLQRGRLFERALADDFPRQVWLETHYRSLEKSLGDLVW